MEIAAQMDERDAIHHAREMVGDDAQQHDALVPHLCCACDGQQ
jgi:hypothetical protein